MSQSDENDGNCGEGCSHDDRGNTEGTHSGTRNVRYLDTLQWNLSRILSGIRRFHSHYGTYHGGNRHARLLFDLARSVASRHRRTISAIMMYVPTSKRMASIITYPAEIVPLKNYNHHGWLPRSRPHFCAGSLGQTADKLQRWSRNADAVALGPANGCRSSRCSLRCCPAGEPQIAVQMPGAHPC